MTQREVPWKEENGRWWLCARETQVVWLKYLLVVNLRNRNPVEITLIELIAWRPKQASVHTAPQRNEISKSWHKQSVTLYYAGPRCEINMAT